MERTAPAVGMQIRCKPPGADGWHWGTVLHATMALEGEIRLIEFKDSKLSGYWSCWDPNEWSRWEPTHLSQIPGWTSISPDLLRRIASSVSMSSAACTMHCNKQWHSTLSQWTELWRTILMACSGTFAYESRWLCSGTQRAFDSLGAAEWRRQGALQMAADERCAVSELAGVDPRLMAADGRVDSDSKPDVASASGIPKLPPRSIPELSQADYVKYTLEVWEHPEPVPPNAIRISFDNTSSASSSSVQSFAFTPPGCGWPEHSWSHTLDEALQGKPKLLLSEPMAASRIRGTKIRDAATVNMHEVTYGVVSSCDGPRAGAGLMLALDPTSSRTLHFVVSAQSPLDQFEETPIWELVIHEDDLLKAGQQCSENDPAVQRCTFGVGSTNHEFKWFPAESRPANVLGRRCRTSAFGTPTGKSTFIVPSPFGTPTEKQLDAPVHLILRQLGDRLVLDRVTCEIDDDVWERLELQPKFTAKWPVHYFVQFAECSAVWEKCCADTLASASMYPFVELLVYEHWRSVYELLRGCVGQVLSEDSDAGTYMVKFVNLDAEPVRITLSFMLPFAYLVVMEHQENAEYYAQHNGSISALHNNILASCSQLQQQAESYANNDEFEQANSIYKHLDHLEKTVMTGVCETS